MDSSVSPKDEIWFLRVCDHISNAVYLQDIVGYHMTKPKQLKIGGLFRRLEPTYSDMNGDI